MNLRVAVAGASGYAGGEILRLLLSHPAFLSGQLEVGALTAASSAGTSVSELLPHLPQLAHRVITATSAEELSGHDIVFLALPHGFSAEIAEQLADEVLVIDCAADFRLSSSQDWQHYYGSTYAGSWPYGLPEMPGHRGQIAASKRIAVPGCFPTGATLALLPAIIQNLIEPDISLVSVTGVSGAGKKASVDLLGAEVMSSLKAYQTAGKHRHTPEIIQNLEEYSSGPVNLSFTPVLAPLVRGILSTATAPLSANLSTEDAVTVFTEFYAAEPFVTVLPVGMQPQTRNVQGSNMCQIQVEVDERAHRLVVTSAIDNLVKGTAGAAIQNMNLALGWAETSGLSPAGLAP